MGPRHPRLTLTPAPITFADGAAEARGQVPGGAQRRRRVGALAIRRQAQRRPKAWGIAARPRI